MKKTIALCFAASLLTLAPAFADDKMDKDKMDKDKMK